jgi:hypothetical protein
LPPSRPSPARHRPPPTSPRGGGRIGLAWTASASRRARASTLRSAASRPRRSARRGPGVDGLAVHAERRAGLVGTSRTLTRRRRPRSSGGRLRERVGDDEEGRRELAAPRILSGFLTFRTSPTARRTSALIVSCSPFFGAAPASANAPASTRARCRRR